MSRDQILKVLLSVRSCEEGEGDPLVEEAFRAMESDPGLKEAWEKQRRWDSAIGASLKSLPPPLGLKEKILRIQREKETEKENSSKVTNVIQFTRSFWVPLAAAALLVLSFGVWKLEQRAVDRDFAVFESEAVDYTKGLFTLSKKSGEMSEVRAWLAAHRSPHTFKIPFHVEGLAQLGCRQVEFCGIQSSMICFEVEGLKKEVHLFVLSKEEVKNLPAYGVPEFRQKHGNAIAAWTDDEHGYVLTGDVSLEEMKGLF
jgi:hypothetical protein